MKIDKGWNWFSVVDYFFSVSNYLGMNFPGFLTWEVFEAFFFFFFCPLTRHSSSIFCVNGFGSICVRIARTIPNANPLSSKNIYIIHFRDKSIWQIHQHKGEQGYWISIIGISGILKVAGNLGESLFNSSLIPMQDWSNFTEVKNVA